MKLKLKYYNPIPKPLPLGKGLYNGGYRPCDLPWGFAPNPVSF